MSRIGNRKIVVPSGVTVTNENNIVTVKGPKGTLVKELHKKFFTNLIDYAQGIDENIKKKPSPDAIFAIIDKLNAQNEKNIFVGDSEVDIETAQNANIPCISVSWGFKTKEFLIQHNATHIIDTPLELLDIIDKL